MNKKQTIRLNEAQLKRVIAEATAKFLKEYGETPKGQKALGALHARKVLKTNGETEDEFFDNQRDATDKWYNLAKDHRSHLGDDIDDFGNITNPLYNDYANGYLEYMTTHPDERSGYDERLRAARLHENFDNIGLDDDGKKRVGKRQRYKSLLLKMQGIIEKLKQLSEDTAMGDDEDDDKIWNFCYAYDQLIDEYVQY